MTIEHDFYTELTQHRRAIDAIDDRLIALLNERCEYVAQVGRLKSKHQLHGSYIRPAREAMMVRALLDKSQGAFPRASIAAIWRIIIGSSTAIESPLSTLTFADDAEGNHVAAQYFGPEVPHQSAPSEQEFFQQLESNPHCIAIVPYVLDASWWQLMPDPMRVFACLPFVGVRPSHLALGHIEAEPTGDDMSLFYDYETRTVFEQRGFHCAEHPLIPPLKHALFIGAYALPCAL